MTPASPPSRGRARWGRLKTRAVEVGLNASIVRSGCDRPVNGIIWPAIPFRLPIPTRLPRGALAVDSPTYAAERPMNANDPDPVDDFTRLHAKMSALEIVLGVLIGRLSEENPEIREDVKRDVAVILGDLPIDGPSEELIAAEVKRAADVLTSVSIG